MKPESIRIWHDEVFFLNDWTSTCRNLERERERVCIELNWLLPPIRRCDLWSLEILQRTSNLDRWEVERERVLKLSLGLSWMEVVSMRKFLDRMSSWSFFFFVTPFSTFFFLGQSLSRCERRIQSTSIPHHLSRLSVRKPTTVGSLSMWNGVCWRFEINYPANYA